MKINNWIGWNYKSRADEIVDLVLDEVNDMLKKNKIKETLDLLEGKHL